MLKSFSYLIFSLAMVFYALPRMRFFNASTESFIFSISWAFFALLIIGAHVDQLLILDEEKRKRLNQLRRYRIWKKEQEILAIQRNSQQRRQYVR